MTFESRPTIEEAIAQVATDIGTLLDGPTGVGLEELTVGVDWPPIDDPSRDSEWGGLEDEAASFEPLVSAIAARQRPSLRSIGLHGADGDLLVHEAVDCSILGLEALWPNLPQLELLALTGREIELGRLDVPKVRSAELSVCEPQQAGFVRSLAESKWPTLERLVLNLGDPQFTNSTASADDLVHVFENGGMPRLRHLALLGFCPIDDFLPWLVQSPVLAQLVTLTFYNCPISDSGARLLLARPDAFQNLQRLRFEGIETDDDLHDGLLALCDDTTVLPGEAEWSEWRSHFEERPPLQ